MIHLRFIASAVRGERLRFDTSRPSMALGYAAMRWYGAHEMASDVQVFAVVMERDGVELSREELIARLRDIVEMEEARVEREDGRA